MEELYYIKCQDVKHVPETFGSLTCLKKLDMSEYEALEVFPYGLSMLIALEELWCYEWRALKHMPQRFGTMTCMKKLKHLGV